MCLSLTVISFGYSQDTPTKNNYYDFSQTKTIRTLGDFKIKSTDIRTIVFDSLVGDVSDKDIFDKGDTLGFNIDMLYRCVVDTHTYYFRMYWQSVDRKITTLYVHWEPSMPYIFNKTARIDIVEAPFIQNGIVSVCTIGDSQTWLFHGENYRHFWSQLDGNLKFIGNRTDYWGFGHEGEGGNSSLAVIERMNNFKRADMYVLLIGTNDRRVNITVEQTVENIDTIVRHLKSINKDARIYLLTTLPCTEVDRDNENRQINVLMKSRFSDVFNVSVLDTEKIFREKENWRSLFIDGLHPNDPGYKLLTRFLSENIKWIILLRKWQPVLTSSQIKPIEFAKITVKIQEKRVRRR